MKNYNETKPTTLSGLVDRFMNDDKYAKNVVIDSIINNSIVNWDDLFLCFSTGLQEKYMEMTGKDLNDVDALVITHKVVENRCDELGICCDIDSIDKRIYWMTCIDEDGEPVDTYKNFQANTYPLVKKLAEAKAHAMCVRI